MSVKKQRVIIYPDERGYTIIEDKKEKESTEKLKELDMDDLKLWKKDEMKFSDDTDIEYAS